MYVLYNKETSECIEFYEEKINNLETPNTLILKSLNPTTNNIFKELYEGDNLLKDLVFYPMVFKI